MTRCIDCGGEIIEGLDHRCHTGPEQSMNPTGVYRLKLQIDQVLKPYGASAISWPTHWCVLRIVKYDCPWEALRSVIYSNFIKDEADWLARKDEIVAELDAMEQQKGGDRCALTSFQHGRRR